MFDELFARKCVSMRACARLVSMCMCVCVCVCVCVGVCVCVCIYIYIYIYSVLHRRYQRLVKSQVEMHEDIRVCTHTHTQAIPTRAPCQPPHSITNYVWLHDPVAWPYAPKVGVADTVVGPAAFDVDMLAAGVDVTETATEETLTDVDALDMETATLSACSASNRVDATAHPRSGYAV
jgi:hypothetical protein